MKQNSTSSDIRAGSSQPELFTADGHLTDLAFKLLIDEQLDSLQSLEVSEHLSFCDRCLERYTEILCSDAPVDLDTGQEREQSAGWAVYFFPEHPGANQRNLGQY